MRLDNLVDVRSWCVVLLMVAVGSLGRAEEQKVSLAEAKAAFTKADRALNEAWAAIKKKLPDAVFADLKTKQREWIESRDKSALAASPNQDKAEARQSPLYFQTAARLTEERARWLKQRVLGQDDTLTGVWRDGQDGMLEVVEQKERLLFVFHVVRGRSHDVGILAGVAAWNSGIGWFSDKGREKDKEDETNISFTETNGRLEVVGANTSYYHGRHAYFDGAYYKIAPLDDHEQAKIIKAAESGEVSEE